MLGLKRGEIALFDHQTEWKEIADETIKELKKTFGAIAIDIQHIGSTAIHQIKAKPVIDIAVGVNDFDDVLPLKTQIENKGFIFRGFEGKERQPVFQCAEYPCKLLADYQAKYVNK